MKFIPMAIGLTLLSACASTLRTDFSYSPDDGTSLLILEERSSLYQTSNSVMFAEVDLENEVFLSDRLTVQQGLMNRLEKGESLRSFSVDKVDGGNWALVSTYTVRGNTYTTNCFSLGTMVYEFPEASVIILPLSPSEYFDDLSRIMPEKVEDRRQDLFNTVRQQLQNYPDVDASNLVIAKPVAAITFEGKKQMFGTGCPVGNKLEPTSLDEMLDKQTDPMAQLRELFSRQGLDLDKMIEDRQAKNAEATAEPSED